MKPDARTARLCAVLCLILAMAVPAAAVVVPEHGSRLADKEFRDPALDIHEVYRTPAELPAAAAHRAAADLAALGVPARDVRVDPLGGRFGTLVTAQPVIPGDGLGNRLRWGDLRTTPPAGPRALESAAWGAFARWLGERRSALRIDPAELPRPGRLEATPDGSLIQIHAPRTVAGIPVRDSYVTAVINHGNLVLFGAHRWGDVEVDPAPALGEQEAAEAVRAYLGIDGFGFWRRTRLEIVPTAAAGSRGGAAGYGHRLVWVVSPEVAGELAHWEALVDAHDGELLAFEDLNRYATTRRVRGGVFPVSNDGVPPDGTEQASWPMPFADLAVASCGNGVCEPSSGEDCLSCAADCRGVQSGNPSNRYCCGDGAGQNPVGCGDARCNGGGFTCSDAAASSFFTDTGGNLNGCVDGNVVSRLDGRYLRMADQCGSISLTASGDVDFGTSGGTDCTTPGIGGAGNTHASRTGFYELNRIAEMARGQLPDNKWLTQQLTSNMNINLSCNAFWSGATVNFYRSGTSFGTFCNNTGEIAGIFDHEWGHGLDDNDVNPSISNPGEGIPDVYASLRLNTSCIGRNFTLGNCGGYGDPCVACSGVRDIDWAKRASGTPHGLSGPLGVDALCGSGGSAPCGGSSHCEGAAYSEAVWDLFNRDLPSFYGMDHNTSMEVATRLTYIGAGAVGTWFQCSAPFGGCSASGGYLNFLVADDDNGSLADGTPHMQAIFSAFNRHQIACSTPAVADSGCAGAPTSAPSVTASAIDRGAALSWGAVTGASKYAVFRTEGVAGCNFGKVKVAETTGTSVVDGGLLNGRGYSYVVAAIGPADTCIGPASSCTAVTPSPGPNLAVAAESADLAIVGGDGDGFLDNCETAELSFDAFNIGTGGLTNVRIVSVDPVSHPTLTVLTSLPSTLASSLSACGSAAGLIELVAENGELGFDDTLVVDVEVTSDELAALGLTKTGTMTVRFTESDLQNQAAATFGFEAGRDGWQTVQGTFDRTSAGGGGNGTSFYLASSSFLSDQCDQVTSPLVRLSASSTMSLYDQFDVEPIFGGSTWYDRANIGLVEVATGKRTPVSPSGGRLYNASGANGTCGTEGQAGWAGAATGWAQSTWTATALGSAASAGKLLQLDVRYGTDGSLEGSGFHFDQVRLTNFDLQVADGQSDTCSALPFCGDAICNGSETQCSCPADCGAPPGAETGLCTDGFDNDCDLAVDCADADCSTDPACSGPVCGNGTCEPGEDCLSCSSDCDGKQNGPPSGRFCCGDGIPQPPEGGGAICDGNF